MQHRAGPAPSGAGRPSALDPRAVFTDPVAAAFHHRDGAAEEPRGADINAAAAAAATAAAAERRVADLRLQLRSAKKKESDATSAAASLRQRVDELQREHAQMGDELYETTELCVQLKSALSQYRKRTQELEAALRSRGQLPPELAVSPDMRRLLAVEKELQSTKKQHMLLLEHHELAMNSQQFHHHQQQQQQQHVTSLRLSSPVASRAPSERSSSVTVTASPDVQPPPPRVIISDDDLMKNDAVLGIVRQGRLESMEVMLLGKNTSIATLQEQCATMKAALEVAMREAEGAKAKARLYENANKQLRAQLDEAQHRNTVLERDYSASEEALKLMPQLKLRLQLLESELSSSSASTPAPTAPAAAAPSSLPSPASLKSLAKHVMDVSDTVALEAEGRLGVCFAESLEASVLWERKSKLGLQLFGLDSVVGLAASFSEL